MKRWNPENLMHIHTDEFKYLDEIREIIELSEDITELLNKIWNYQRFNIQCGTEKDMADFTEVKSKLNELKNIIIEL
jgi:hypothetical protein